MASRSRQDLESWLKKIDVKGNVLDVGGSQNPIEGRTEKWNVKDYRILDLAKPHECKKKPDIIHDLNNFNLECESNKLFINFDVVFCIEVFEYIWDQINALNCIYSVMKDGGVLYISTHYLYGLHKPKGLDCIRYTKDGIKKILNETGFTIKEIIPREVSEEAKHHLSRFYSSEGMRINYDDPSWCHSGHLIKAVK